MSERKSSRRKKVERPVEQRQSSPEGTAIKEPEEKRTSYPTSAVSIHWDSLNTKRRIDEPLRAEIVELYFNIQKKPEAQIAELEKKIEEFPDLSILYNFLFMAYYLEDMNEKAIEQAEILAKKFPDYVFGKTGFVEKCILKNELNKVPAYLNDKYSYREVFPEKGVFHILEVIQFCYTVGKFLALNGEAKEAEKYRDEIKSIDPEHIYIKRLQKVIDKSAGVKFYQKVLRRFRKSS